MIIVLFGLPGSGKNFIAKIFQDYFGFHIFDADKVLPRAALQAIKNNSIVSESTRRAFYKQLAITAKRFEKKHGFVVIPRTFTFNRSRRYFKRLIPWAIFISVNTKRKIRYQRITKRNHHVTLEYAKQFDRLFEKPRIAYHVINNNNKKLIDLQHNISKILKASIQIKRKSK